MHIHIYYTVGGLKINNQLYLGYSKREARNDIEQITD